MSEKYEALCISAGGIKGFCALGAIQYLQDSERIDVKQVKHFSGTSIGSTIAFFLAIGYTPIEMMVYFSTHSVFDNIKFKKIDEIFSTEAIFDYAPLQREFEKMSIAKLAINPTFRDLFETHGIDLTIATYNLTKMQTEYISYRTHPDSLCLEATQMSSTLPFLFNPFILETDEYIDGGFADDFPIEQLPFLEKKTVGIYLQDIEKESAKKGRLQELSGKLLKIISIASRELHKYMIERVRGKVDIITIGVEDTPVYRFDLKKGERLDLFSIGYTTAKEFFESENSHQFTI